MEILEGIIGKTKSIMGSGLLIGVYYIASFMA